MRHTTMPTRIQSTPYGDVTLSSRWMRDRYYLVATGTEQSLKLLFNDTARKLESVSHTKWRMAFQPAPTAITVERELRQACSLWQSSWDEMLETRDTVVPNGATNIHISTLGELFDHLKQARSTKLKPNTHQADIHCLKHWEREIGREHILAQLTDEIIQSAFDRISAKLKPSSANRSLGTLKTYLNWASNKGMLTHAPHKNVRQKRIYRTHNSVQWWTPSEVETALSCAREDRTDQTAELLIALGCFLGLRYEEIIMQRWEDIDLDTCSVHDGTPQPVCHIVPNGGWEPKDGEARTVPICTELHAILSRHQKENGYVLKAEITRAKRGGTKRVYRYNPSRVWKRTLKAAMQRGVKRITPYGMRHTFASNLIIANVSDVKVAHWLGHADTRIVHKHYGHMLAYDNDINRLT